MILHMIASRIPVTLLYIYNNVIHKCTCNKVYINLAGKIHVFQLTHTCKHLHSQPRLQFKRDKVSTHDPHSSDHSHGGWLHVRGEDPLVQVKLTIRLQRNLSKIKPNASARVSRVSSQEDAVHMVQVMLGYCCRRFKYSKPSSSSSSLEVGVPGLMTLLQIELYLILEFGTKNTNIGKYT